MSNKKEANLLPAYHPDGRRTRFTELAWSMLPPHKNGWTLDKKVVEVNNMQGGAEKPTDVRMRQLIAQAQGFEKDQNWEGALQRWRQIKATDPTNEVAQGKIDEMLSRLTGDEAPETTGDEAPEMTQADIKKAAMEAFKKEEFETALELFSSLTNQTAPVKNKIAEC